MVHVKYYVFLMIGIFMSLGLGIMIGITLENRDVLENQQIQIARQIEDHFIAMRSETDSLKNQLKELESQRSEMEGLTALLLDETVKNRLAGLRVAVLCLENPEGLEEMLSFVRTTGAIVESCIFLQALPAPHDVQDGSQVMSLPDTGRLLEELAEDLICAMVYGGMSERLEALEAQGLVVNTIAYDDPVDVVILFGGKGEVISGQGRLDILLIENASDYGIPIIAVENGERANSFIPEYIRYGISTVDHAETEYGKLALVSLLSGRHGNFGLIQGVQGRLPQPLFLEPDPTEADGDFIYEPEGET